MPADTQTASGSKMMLWAGWIISAIASLLLFMDGAMKLAKPDFVVQATLKLGYHEGVIVGLGMVLLACVAFYAIPWTSVLGAILLTGYLGGAVASHLRAGDGAFEVLFPAIFGVVVWGGLYLRDARLRALVPLRSPIGRTP